MVVKGGCLIYNQATLLVFAFILVSSAVLYHTFIAPDVEKVIAWENTKKALQWAKTPEGERYLSERYIPTEPCCTYTCILIVEAYKQYHNITNFSYYCPTQYEGIPYEDIAEIQKLMLFTMIFVIFMAIIIELIKIRS